MHLLTLRRRCNVLHVGRYGRPLRRAVAETPCYGCRLSGGVAFGAYRSPYESDAHWLTYP